MVHEMKLRTKPFEDIKRGRKTIEMRLYDEKRSKIIVGDMIRFTEMDSGDTVRVRVKALYRFDSFKELYENFDKEVLGYEADEEASYLDMIDYYSLEEQKKYGVVGIEIELI